MQRNQKNKTISKFRLPSKTLISVTAPSTKRAEASLHATAKLITNSRSTSSEWASILRNVQLTMGGWGCELIELRRCERIFPVWCAELSPSPVSISDED